MYTIMYSTDSPINIRSLFYVPEQHMERYGVRLEPGVSLFCRKVLIQQKAKGLLPEWLRFVKGEFGCEIIFAAANLGNRCRGQRRHSFELVP